MKRDSKIPLEWKENMDTDLQPRLTEHAGTRCQQRGIQNRLMFIAYKYGTCKRGEKGRFIYRMDHKARRKARKHLDKQTYKSLADYLNIGVVVSSDRETLITAYHLD